LSKNKSTLINQSLNDDRLYKIEQERSDLQRSLVQTSTQFDQLASENHGLTVALDDLRREMF
jgi:ABC-type phosphate transport system auxiliary subunit